jgi:hypothetical protein
MVWTRNTAAHGLWLRQAGSGRLNADDMCSYSSASKVPVCSVQDLCIFKSKTCAGAYLCAQAPGHNLGLAALRRRQVEQQRQPRQGVALDLGRKHKTRCRVGLLSNKLHGGADFALGLIGIGWQLTAGTWADVSWASYATY